MTEAPAEGASARWLRHPLVLAAAVVLVYLPSLWGGWLRYDDDWLLEQNELLTRGDLDVLPRILFDFELDRRLMLGAEYLPVRDLVTWLLRGVLGLDVTPLRIALLGAYVGAVLLLQFSALRLPRAVQLAVWLFALHPVHAESVAWLAGFKDVLALLFLFAALALYGTRHRFALLGVPLLVGLACFAKAAVVIGPGVLWVFDRLGDRRTDFRTLGASALVAVLAAGVHLWVGSLVAMYAEPLADGWLGRVLTVATILARYLGLSFFVLPSSVFYDVPATNTPDASSLGALALLAVCAAIAALGWRRGIRWPALSLVLFLIGLLPVLQIVAPLQNRMADRYLLVAVLGPMITLGFGVDALLGRLRASLATLLLGGLGSLVGLLALLRGLIFADPIALFDEGTERAPRNAVAPFMLAEALVREHRTAEAEGAYREAIRRDGFRTQRGLRAGNNLGRLLREQGRLDEAQALFVDLVARYPDDARALYNLAFLEFLRGDEAASSRHRAELMERFPEYRPNSDRPGPL